MTSLFSTPKPAPVSPPAVMPTMNDAAVTAAQQQQMAKASQTSGRQSTILTDYGNSQKLGD